MLKKLLKYEFKSLGRVLLPIYCATLAMSLITSVLFKIQPDFNSGAFNILKSMALLASVIYGLTIAASLLVSFFCAIYRLKKRSINAGTRKIKSKELEITELLLAINRCCGKTDYIPCICWNKNARRASEFKVGEHIMIEGEVHSREYLKRHNSKKPNNLNYIVEHRIAYEVFTTKLEVIQEK